MAVVDNGVKGDLDRTSELENGSHPNNNMVQQQQNREMRELEEMLSKLNPRAQEYVPNFMYHPPPQLHPTPHHRSFVSGFPPPPPMADDPFRVFPNQQTIPSFRKKKGSFGQGKRRPNNRTGMAQRDEVIRRTVYVSDIDQQVTEEQLAGLFINYGQVVDCRICGDPNSVLRFAFVEFTDEEGAHAALCLSGTMLGFYPIKVLPSKTAIAPVNPTFLPQNDNEREMCARTVYCTNIDKQISHSEIKTFFETFCGEVHRLRMLGDVHHSTRIAFVEFVMAESAIAALNCSGVTLGSSAIRVSPSKTPVRPRAPRKPVH